MAVISRFTGFEVAESDAPLPFQVVWLDDCKHSEGFTSCGVLQAGRRQEGKDQRWGEVGDVQIDKHYLVSLFPPPDTHKCQH